MNLPIRSAILVFIFTALVTTGFGSISVADGGVTYLPVPARQGPYVPTQAERDQAAQMANQERQFQCSSGLYSRSCSGGTSSSTAAAPQAPAQADQSSPQSAIVRDSDGGYWRTNSLGDKEYYGSDGVLKGGFDSQGKPLSSDQGQLPSPPEALPVSQPVATQTGGTPSSSTDGNAGQNRASGNAGTGASAQAHSQCSKAETAAKSMCATMSFAGMSPENAAMAEMMMGQMMSMAGSMGGGGVADTCQKQADMSDMMKKLTGMKTMACGTAMVTCTQLCEKEMTEAQTKINTVLKPPCMNPSPGTVCQQAELTREEKMVAGDKTNIAQCNRYKTNVMMMLSQAMSFAQNAMQNNACVKATSNSPFSGIGSANGTVDCTIPANASTSPTCICQTDPNNPICPTYKPNLGTAGGLSGPTSNTGGVGAGNPYAVDPSADPGSRLDGALPFAKSTKGNNEIAGAGGGAPSGNGALGGGGEASGRGGAASVGSDKNAITGLAGGGGGGVGGRGGGSSSSGVRGALSGLMDKFNLKKFLPNNKDYKSRGLAGMSVPAKDGITGPMGPSLFEKVSSQYQKQKPALLQDK
jgi:hypothetical protein